ncbi:response regulator [Cellulosilyticum sp. I15G10I2]|uniref:response regulator n=1 Tax=Cellulosilyticum sp. I15G10I2 TaxID=1892843 RepID=UPI00085C38E3|nr:response regulator [Cellulosilyticum sp. I15G10I2]
MKMIIVEDEDILRRGISQVGDWGNRGIEIIGLAKNGVEALEMVEKNKPDIVLTDVVMPFMDGIELTKYLYEKYPEIKVVILSGHEEFQYVKSAIDYKASHYLLKPAKIENIVGVICKLKEEIEEKRRKQQETEQLKIKLEESMPILRDHYLNQLVSKGEENVDELNSQLAFLGITIRDQNLAVMLLELDDKAGSIEDLGIRGMLLKELCEEIIQKEYTCCVFQNIENRVVILLNFDEKLPIKDALKYLTGKAIRIQKESLRRYDRTVSVGIGRLIQNITKMSLAYREAESALTYKFFMGNNSIIYIGDIETHGDTNPYYLEQIEADILINIRSGNLSQTLETIDRYFNELEQYVNKGSTFVRDELIVLAHGIFRTMRTLGDESEPFCKYQESLIKALKRDESMTLSYIKKHFIKTITKLINTINVNRESRNQGIIENAKEFVKNNLDKDISLITVADMVYISPNYLSYLFKESGENFKDYVIRAKMEKATELLKEKKYNHNQIAYALGYSDGRYFSQIYKKYMLKMHKNRDSKTGIAQ